MLVLTDDARDTIERLLSAGSTPPGAGLRIAPSDGGGPQFRELAVSVVALPAEADQVIDDEGARVFVDEAAVEFLDDKVLDAVFSGEEIRFALGQSRQ